MPSLDFKPLKLAVAAQFHKMTKHQMYRTATDPNELWALYLKSFPDGTDPIYKTTTEHDCKCCNSFFRAIANAVTIIDDQVVSIWDIQVDGPYQVVVDALAARVKADFIANIFMHLEPEAGKDKTFQELLEGGRLTWQHFHVNIPNTIVVANEDSMGSLLNGPRTAQETFLRALTTLTDDSLETVLELIAQNSLYRGEEHKKTLETFQKFKNEFNKLETDQQRSVYAWSRSKTTYGAITGIRNSSIGSLLIDLSEGKDLESAIKSFEFKVAGPNYKRTTALVTPQMLANARKEIEDLGVLQDLERRTARIEDISVNNVLHINRSGKSKVDAGNIFDDLAAAMPTQVKKLEKVEEISIEKFIADVLPKAKTVEVLFENKHVPNLVTLVAPVHATDNHLFKWSNGFTWDYNGGMADSDIRQAVQARGGRVDGVFRFSHSWNYDKRNASLMDLHVFMPGSGATPTNEVNDRYYGAPRVGWNRRHDTKSGGVQDVDYVKPAPEGYVPVENITFPSIDKMPEGVYICKVHNWNLRPPTYGGFRAEIEVGGELFQYEYDKPLKHKEWVTVAEVTLKDGQFTVKHHLPETTSSRKVWGLATQTFHKVKLAMLSPNYWDGQLGVGNKHYFFMLEGAENEGSVRGFYNEYLNGKLDTHRKALDMVGAKMKTEVLPDQLSGLGFSSTKSGELYVRVTGATQRVLKVKIKG